MDSTLSSVDGRDSSGVEYRFLRFPADAVRVDPSILTRLPPSAKQVFDALRTNGPLTHSQLGAATGMPARTIRFAVQRLRANGLVASLNSLQDCRICYVFIDRRWVDGEALDAARGRVQDLAGATPILEASPHPNRASLGLSRPSAGHWAA
jgi:hypothetical protein